MKALGVAAVGLDESARGITVDERMRAADGLWAIGDITGHGAFTHMSMYQARIAAADILGEDDAETAHCAGEVAQCQPRTAAGTVKVKDISDKDGFNYLTVVGDVFFFRGSRDDGGSELWKSDGTPASDGTIHVSPPGNPIGKWGGSTNLNTDGTFQFDNVPPGAYTVSIERSQVRIRGQAAPVPMALRASSRLQPLLARFAAPSKRSQTIASLSRGCLSQTSAAML